MTLKYSSNGMQKRTWTMHIITRQLHSQRTDSLRLPQGHRMGIVRFIKGGREDNTMIVR